jgi:hypothetical protein
VPRVYDTRNDTGHHTGRERGGEELSRSEFTLERPDLRGSYALSGTTAPSQLAQPSPQVLARSCGKQIPVLHSFELHT